MTKRIGNCITVEPEEPQQCDDCGLVKELRPYGPNGSKICFECGQKDPEGTEKRLNRAMEILLGNLGNCCMCGELTTNLCSCGEPLCVDCTSLVVLYKSEKGDIESKPVHHRCKV